MNLRWRGRPERSEPQVANASFDDADLSPASEAPAEQTRLKWAATLPDTDPAPLIWERNKDGYGEREPEVWDEDRR
jgi:hypothetical protein